MGDSLRRFNLSEMQSLYNDANRKIHHHSACGGILIRWPFLILLFLHCMLCIPANAAETAPYCVSSSDLPPALLPPPYTEGSPEWKKDIQAVIASQQHISTEELAAVRDEQHMRVELVTDV